MLKKNAIKLNQSPENPVFITKMNRKEINNFCRIERIHRGDDNELYGYQRTHVLNHIEKIKEYINSDNSIIPNSVVICFDSSVTFTPFPDNSDLGEISIPTLSNISTGNPPGFIVDGQQRIAALTSSYNDNFELPVSIFISDEPSFQRQQFILINAAKPLSKSLIYELLPHTESTLSYDMMKKKIPSKITQDLNFNPNSPLFKLIKMITNPNGIIADNSMIKMIDSSIRDGAIYDFRDLDNGNIQLKSYSSILKMISIFFEAVKNVFPDDWGLPPKKSRLFHGAGIQALGQLFDEFYYDFIHHEKKDDMLSFFEKQLHVIKPHCHWHEGYWNFGKDNDGIELIKKWNQIQNLSKDINILTNHLVNIYHKNKNT
ncbi:DGQHR domain-containing protein DpdB [Photobacterium leiognathi]|uniref:DGQHR domain-containing protein DpdB n=1 Tax=Photobacterium leiognathi TaxID=553611 RepID=UPI0029812805|nr:DGQHR domain-containing protein DpdB [Photobacterium leiognathi]